MATQTRFVLFCSFCSNCKFCFVIHSTHQSCILIVKSENLIQIKSFHVMKYTKYCVLFLKVTVIPKCFSFFVIVIIVYIINCLCCYFSFNMLILVLLIFFFFYLTSYTSGPIFFTLATVKVYAWKLMCDVYFILVNGAQFLLIALIRIYSVCGGPLQLCLDLCEGMVNPHTLG